MVAARSPPRLVLPGAGPDRRRVRPARLGRGPSCGERRPARAGDRSPLGTGVVRRLGRALGADCDASTLVARDVLDARSRARPGGGRMIRHRPEGRGHAYLLEPDQRVPVQPVAGDALELRATTGEGVDSLCLEIERHGAIERVEAARVPRVDDAARAAQTTHLSAAADDTGRGRRPEWKVVLDDLAAGERIRYRFTGADGSHTRWHATVAADWSPTGGTLACAPDTDRLVPGSLSWLTAGSTPIRVRFALRLEPDDHVVGFGERFDTLDQRGRALDSVVFEQYKAQGARTYMPMPFAIVVGGGWGFHLPTSRRVWFDVGRSDESLLWIQADPDREPPPELE